jgi:hypothetical protein
MFVTALLLDDTYFSKLTFLSDRRIAECHLDAALGSASK